MEPKALTKDKFLEILKKNEDTEDVQLTKVDLKSGAEKGQNYSGQVVACHLEAKVKGQPKTYEWMAKIPLDDPGRYDWLRMTRMEEKELGFYQDLVPVLKDFIAKKGADLHLDFPPLVYGEFNEGIPKEECVHGSMIIMEHLGHMGFSEPINKKSGLDMAHVKLVMKSLGEFHGASHAYYKAKHGDLKNMIEKEPIQARDFFGSNPTETMKAMMEQFNGSMVTGFYKTLSNISEDGHKYVDSYKRFAKEVMDPIKLRDQLGEPDIFKFNVLCHGDPWFNNMLFKYEYKIPTEVRFVDLALTKWASPTIDLTYFMYMSTTPELRKNHLNEILEYYHQSLTRTLNALGEDPSVFTLSELKADFKKCSFYGFMVSLFALPLILAKKDDVVGSDELFGDFTDPEVFEKFEAMSIDRTKTSMLNEPQIGHRISSAFMEMVDNGYFTL